jgi:hypothetical protein
MTRIGHFVQLFLLSVTLVLVGMALSASAFSVYIIFSELNQQIEERRTQDNGE